MTDNYEIPKILTVGSIFAGIGGIELGLERAGMKVLWQIENDKACLKVLEKHWPEVKRYGDIREITGFELEPVDLICGGFPCQDISCAGKRTGIKGKQSGLFFDLMRIVRILRPQYILLENVAALRNRGLDRVLGELAESGYDAEWGMFSAREFGLPHKRERIIIIAYPQGKYGNKGSMLQPGREIREIKDEFRGLVSSTNWSETRPWEAIHSKPPVYRKIDGLPGELDELKQLGNAVIPEIFEFVGHRIIELDNIINNRCVLFEAIT